MNPATHRPEFAFLPLVSPRTNGCLPPGTDSRRGRMSGPHHDRSAVFSSTYKLPLLSKKRSPSKSTDYKLRGEGGTPPRYRPGASLTLWTGDIPDTVSQWQARE